MAQNINRRKFVKNTAIAAGLAAGLSSFEEKALIKHQAMAAGLAKGLGAPRSLFSDDCRENEINLDLASNAWNKVSWPLASSEYAGGRITPGTPRRTTLDEVKRLRFFIIRDPRR